MKFLSALDNELRSAFAWLALSGVGWLLHSAPLVIIGLLGTATTIAFFVWQRECLVGVRFSQELSAKRATFDELVTLEVEIVNDKLLPLPWLRIDDEVPSKLSVRGGTVIADQGFVDRLVQLLPLLPYQRVRRQFEVCCDFRGEHTFGPASITSGDPIGLRTRNLHTSERLHLLVYPKVFALAPAQIVSRVLIGEARSHFELLQDPSRVAGVREYVQGDPLRNVDWRATARNSTLLVRQFEPSVSLRVALFVDFKVVRMKTWSFGPPELEFTISVASSILSELTERKVATGLYSSGYVIGGPIAQPPSSSPDALPSMLDSLARAAAIDTARFADILSAQSHQLQRGTSIVVVATDFPEATLVALAEVRRRHAVTAVYVETDYGSPPPPELVDAILVARFSDDWQQREVLELAL